MIKGGAKNSAKVLPISILTPNPIPNPDRPGSNIVTKPIKISETVPPLIPNSSIIYKDLVDRK
jgi:hypothetical protein